MRETNSMRAAPAEPHNADLKIFGLEQRFAGAQSADEVRDGGVAEEVLERERDAVDGDADGEEGFDEDGCEKAGGGLELVQYGNHGGAHFVALFKSMSVGWMVWGGGGRRGGTTVHEVREENEELTLCCVFVG